MVVGLVSVGQVIFGISYHNRPESDPDRSGAFFILFFRTFLTFFLLFRERPWFSVLDLGPGLEGKFFSGVFLFFLFFFKKIRTFITFFFFFSKRPWFSVLYLGL